MPDHVNGTTVLHQVGVAKWPDPGVQMQRGNDQPLGAILVNGQPMAFFLQYSQAVHFVAAPIALKHLAQIIDLFVRAPQVDPEDEEGVSAQARAMGEAVHAAKAFLDQHRDTVSQAQQAAQAKIIDPKADAQGQNLLRLGKLVKS